MIADVSFAFAIGYINNFILRVEVPYGILKQELIFKLPDGKGASEVWFNLLK